MTARARRVLEAVRRVGPSVSTNEIVYKTKLSRLAVVEALIELESEGLVEPTYWAPR